MDLEEEDSRGKVVKMTRKSLFELLRKSPKRRLNEKFTFLEEKLMELTKCSVNDLGLLRQALKSFKFHFKAKWQAASCKAERFIQKNEEWLNTPVTLPDWSTKKPGRPSINFEESSDRTKRRKTKELRTNVPHDELTYAAQMSHRAAGQSDVSKLMKDMTSSPTRAKKFRKILCAPQKPVKKHTPAEALAIFVEADLTRSSYEVIHRANKNIYPCYSLLKRAKKDCYPRESSVRVTETCAEVNLQDLLDHTSSRLCKYLVEVLESTTKNERKELELISKWGCDGSQQETYKQKFHNITDSDANIFQSSLVPIRLVCNHGNKKRVLWQNPVPSSTRYCRPIRIRFVHETNDITKEEIRYVEDQAKKLTPSEIPMTSGLPLKIKHTLALTMVDGKVCNAATSTSSTMRCYICGQTSKDFNNLNKINPENHDALKFGLSTLHARIRMFESILHLAYKNGIKKWQARTQNEKQIVATEKKRIQDAFKEEMGLLVDIPKPGFGNTNDGNTSRKFFSDPETSSRITGIDIDLITKFKIILEAITSGYKIDVRKFADYTANTAKLYVTLYGWHPMTPTIHKILIHGATVIKHALVPIGQLSEEAAEARNKHFRLYRQHFSRKFSRVDCNMDVLNRLLLTSDPFLSSMRQTPRKNGKPFSSETIELLVPETSDVSEDDESESN